jgi:general secretion pathway protein G
MRRHDAGRAGFTLVEILLVLAIIAGIAAVVIPNLLTAREQADVDQTHIRIEKVMGALERYATKLPYPTSEQGLKALVEKPTFDKPEQDKNWFGPYLNASDLKDAWDQDLSYKLEDVTDASGKTRQVPHIYSFGPNKTDDSGDGDDIKNKTWADESASASK